MFVLPLSKSGTNRRRWRAWSVVDRGHGRESILLQLGSVLGRRRLQSEGLWLRKLARGCDGVLDPFLSGTFFHRSLFVVVCWWLPATVSRRVRVAGGIRRGLGAKLGEVEVAACLIAVSHRLSEASLGPEAVEDEAVNRDNEEFNDNLNDGTDKGPVLVFRQQVGF